MVTPIGIQRLERRLRRFDGLIDMSDYDTRPADQGNTAFLSRAVAAYCVKILSSVADDVAAKSITDSYHDRGIDAIYFDVRLSRLLLVQSKWSDCIAWRDAGEFVDGVRRLIKPDWSSFLNNKKISDRRTEIDFALGSSGTKILLVTAHKGAKAGDGQSLRRVDEIAAEIDGGSGLAETVHWHQKHLLEAIEDESQPPRIDADLCFSNWGEIKKPYHAIYGRVQARAVAELWKNHPHLAHMNIRGYSVQRTEVNAAIAQTVASEPQDFWYFNNGLTVICDSIKPAVLGRLNPDIALFHLEGVCLVNGAQTTGIVSDNLSLLLESEQNELWIQLRAIAVGNCPDGFAAQITKFTNLQNAVRLQDFVGFDPTQSRLAIDFAVENRRYSFKWGGDPDPSGDFGCTLKEATIALACADPESKLAVQAKREISLLWDTDSERYTRLFHKDLTAQRVWNAVKIMRAVDAKITELGGGEHEKSQPVAGHLKLLILHVVFQSPELLHWDIKKDSEELVPVAKSVCERIFKKTCELVAGPYDGSYLAPLSKNFDKCEGLIQKLKTSGKIPTLFDHLP